MFVPRLLGVVLLGIAHLVSSCEDLDSQACAYMANTRTDFCLDDTIAKTACPKFCNRCPPIRCYSCNSTLSDYHLCTTTITCRTGEVCMRRELRSMVDGHAEFELTCATKPFCDDPWQGISMFGKREMMPRDVSVSCCATDLCNYPMVTTTTTTTTSTTTAQPATVATGATTTAVTATGGCKGCCRDLMIAVDESRSINPSKVKQFLRNVVSGLSIGSTETLVSLGMFASTSRTIFDISDHVTKSSTLAAISAADFNGGIGYITAGVDYLINHATSSAGGDRANYPNIILIITDGTRSSISTSKEAELHSKAAHVISVEIGPTHYSFLASSPAYQVHVHSQSSLNSVYVHVMNLICENISSWSLLGK